MKHLLFIIVFCLGLAPRAEAFVEFNGFYMSDSLNTGSTTTSSNMFFEGAVGFEVDRNGRFLVGWNYGMYSKSRSATTTESYSSTQMGPRFIWFITKSKAWSAALAYNLVTQATYDSGGGTSEKWKGTGIKFDTGYNFTLTDSWLLGLRVNYSTTSYNEKLVGSTTYSTITNNSTLLYPSIYTIYLF